jgi:hypothetical protein
MLDTAHMVESEEYKERLESAPLGGLGECSFVIMPPEIYCLSTVCCCPVYSIDFERLPVKEQPGTAFLKELN